MDEQTTFRPIAPAARTSGQFLSMGELLIDFIVTDDAHSLLDARSFSPLPGGAPANVAVALARLGLPSAVSAVTGVDPFGERLVRALAAEQVDTSRIRKSPAAATTLAFAWKDEQQDGHFWFLGDADKLLDRTDAEQAGIDNLACLIVGSVSLAAEPARSCIYHAATLAALAGVPVCLDVNFRPALWPNPDGFAAAVRPVLENASVVKLSLQDAVGLFGVESPPSDVIQRVAALAGTAAIVLTGGEHGAWFLEQDSGEVRHVPVFDVPAIEPTGAGDAFTAALLRRLSLNSWQRPSFADVQYAAAAGALATTKPGAWAALPTSDDLDDFLRKAHPAR